MAKSKSQRALFVNTEHGEVPATGATQSAAGNGQADAGVAAPGTEATAAGTTEGKKLFDQLKQELRIDPAGPAVRDLAAFGPAAVSPLTEWLGTLSGEETCSTSTAACHILAAARTYGAAARDCADRSVANSTFFKEICRAAARVHGPTVSMGHDTQ